jgi:hypothetical protein
LRNGEVVSGRVLLLNAILADGINLGIGSIALQLQPFVNTKRSTFKHENIAKRGRPIYNSYCNSKGVDLYEKLELPLGQKLLRFWSSSHSPLYLPIGALSI